MAVPVLVINRAVDTGRLAAFRTSAAEYAIDPTRIDAVDAHRPDFPAALYEPLLRDRFWGQADIKPGAIGCFLSHRRAWQHVVDQDLTMALICEDDASFLATTDQLELAALGLPDFDVVFANGRMARWCAAVGEHDLKRLDQVLTDLAAFGGPKSTGLKPTPGGDCYLVSRTGAETLLARTAEQGIQCGVDWAMVRNGVPDVTPEIARAFPELLLLKLALAVPKPMQMFVLARPVADQRPGDSVLQHSVSVPITTLRKRDANLAHVETISTISLGGAPLAFACRSGPDPVMEAQRNGQIWDEPGLCALLERFPSGGTFVDIGAHCGSHSVVMARLGGASRVIAFEPNGEIHRLLRTNMVINGVAGCLDLHPPGTALASKAGDGWLLRNRKRSSETMVKPERPDDAEDPQVDPVRLVPGDDLLAAHKGPIHAIKIDTAGSEVDVIKGLRRTLDHHKPVILLDHSAGATERISRLADEIDYRVRTTVPSGRKNRVSALLMPRPDGGL